MQEPVMLDITVSRREKLVEYVIHSAEPDTIDAMTLSKQSSQSSDQLWATRHIQRGAGIRAIVSDVQPKI